MAGLRSYTLRTIDVWCFVRPLVPPLYTDMVVEGGGRREEGGGRREGGAAKVLVGGMKKEDNKRPRKNTKGENSKFSGFPHFPS